MTTQSYWESAIGRLNLTNALRSLEPAHHADELPEQPAGRAEDRDTQDHRGHVDATSSDSAAMHSVTASSASKPSTAQ